MRCIIVVVTSLDGFITRGDDPNPASWTSKEDQNFFSEMKNKYPLIVMGSNTYDLNNVEPKEGFLRVILTRNPDKYSGKVVKNQLEFHSLTPYEFVEKYQNQFESCLVLGGSYVYTAFLEAGLIDEIYLTVEPVFNKTGVPLLTSSKHLTDFKLPSPTEEVLNEKGTLLKHYVLKK